MDRYFLFSMVQTKVQLRKSSLKAILDLLTKPIKALGQNKQFEFFFLHVDRTNTQ